jgi:cystathionine gamma-synthase/methionine-gamma-lyase
MEPSTLVVHAGAGDRRVGEAVLNPLVPATSFFSHPDAIGFSANDLGADAPHFYARWSNPTVDLLERRLAALDDGEAAVAFASGMAAISGLFLHLLKAGDHLVLSNVCYAGVAELAHDILPGFGIRISAVDTSDVDAVAAAIRPETKLVHLETPANPILRLADIAAIAEIAHARGIPVSVDSTLATPIATRPIDFGADFVVHSLTKYVCGHGDALGGVVIGRREAIADLKKVAGIHFGAVLSPFAAWLILRGLETLPARMAQHQANAAAVVDFLAKHPRIAKVWWPGSPDHPQADLARRQMRNFSGMLAFSAEDDLVLARRLAERLGVFAYAVSLGKTRSLLFHIPSEDILRSSFHLDGAAADAYRAVTGTGTFRVSVGLEDPSDLLADLEQALG